MERNCYFCGIPIHECMGFVTAGDFLALLHGDKPTSIRELCGLCVLKHDSIFDPLTRSFVTQSAPR